MKVENIKAINKTFEYNGFTFSPVRRFSQKETDFGSMSKKLDIELASKHKELRRDNGGFYSWNGFMEAAKTIGAENYDIFKLIEDGKCYTVIPCNRCLFTYLEG